MYVPSTKAHASLETPSIPHPKHREPIENRGKQRWERYPKERQESRSQQQIEYAPEDAKQRTMSVRHKRAGIACKPNAQLDVKREKIRAKKTIKNKTWPSPVEDWGIKNVQELLFRGMIKNREFGGHHSMTKEIDKKERESVEWGASYSWQVTAHMNAGGFKTKKKSPSLTP